MHKMMLDGHFFYKDEKTQLEYHYKLAFSILLRYKKELHFIYSDFDKKVESELNYPSILEIFEEFDLMK